MRGSAEATKFQNGAAEATRLRKHVPVGAGDVLRLDHIRGAGGQVVDREGERAVRGLEDLLAESKLHRGAGAERNDKRVPVGRVSHLATVYGAGAEFLDRPDVGVPGERSICNNRLARVDRTTGKL